MSSDEPLDGAAFADSLLRLVTSRRSLGRLQIVFLFDEIEAVLSAGWGGGFLAHWRMLLNNMGELSRSVSAAFSGAEGIYKIAQDVGSPLGNILAWHELGLFPREETARLVREPSEHHWPEPLVDRVHDATGGHPCVIQYLMQRLCDREVERWPEVLPTAERQFIHEQGPLFYNWWQHFDDVARDIYADLSHAGATAEADLIARHAHGGKRALDVLAHTGVIRWDKAARTVELAGTLFRDWVLDGVLAGARAGGPATVGGGSSQSSPARAEPTRRVATVLFTDIVGSSAHTARVGDREWRDVLGAHNARVRAALVAFGGREVNTTGDGFLAVFDAPAHAIRCACAISDSVRQLGIEIRAGLHAGECELVGDDVTGVAVNFGSWVMSKAKANDVLVSSTLRGLVAGAGIRFKARGVYAVKGTGERHRLFAVDRSTSGADHIPKPDGL